MKISITLSEDLLEAIDQSFGEYKNRSDFIEAAIRAYIDKIIRDEQNAKDLAVLNSQAHRLNQETADASSRRRQVITGEGYLLGEGILEQP